MAAESPARVGALLTEEEISTLEEIGQTQVRPVNTIFMVEGEETDFVLLIRKGIVQVMAGHPARIVGFRRAGEVVGEMAPIRRKPRSATVQAVTDVVAVVILADQWRGFLRDHHDATIAMLNMVDERLDEATRKIVESDFLVERRVAGALLEFAEVKGETSASSRFTEMRVSQADIASLSGVKLPSVKATLAAFRQDQLISTGRERLVIRDSGQLREIATGILSKARAT